jgi:ribosomal protein L10
MSKTLAEKKDICTQVEELLKENSTCLFVKHSTITGDEFVDFRKLMQQAGGQVVCVKKSLLSRVLKEDLKKLSQQDGSLMMVVTKDPLPVMNSLSKSMKKFQGFAIHESIMDNKILSLKTFKDLSKYSDRNAIISATLTHMKLPALQLVSVLEQVKDTKQDVKATVSEPQETKTETPEEKIETAENN